MKWIWIQQPQELGPLCRWENRVSERFCIVGKVRVLLSASTQIQRPTPCTPWEGHLLFNSATATSASWEGWRSLSCLLSSWVWVIVPSLNNWETFGSVQSWASDILWTGTSPRFFTSCSAQDTVYHVLQRQTQRVQQLRTQWVLANSWLISPHTSSQMTGILKSDYLTGNFIILLWYTFRTSRQPDMYRTLICSVGQRAVF